MLCGGLRDGFRRVAHLRPALLPGGDAAAQYPVQAAAGFLYQLDDLCDLSAAPFYFPNRFARALELVRRQSRCFVTTSIGRLFDAVSALLGFTGEVTYEGQAAIAVEQLASQSFEVDPYLFPFEDNEFDFRPLLQQIIEDRVRDRDVREIARAFHSGLANGVADAARSLSAALGVENIAVSGGVFQNDLLLGMLKDCLEGSGLQLMANHRVPSNDGGISLGQAAIAANSAIRANEFGSQAVRIAHEA